MRRRCGVRAGGLAAVLAAVTAAPAAAQQETDSGLPPGEGREIVETLCAACHSLDLVKQQGMSRHRWDTTLVWMVEKQGMPDLPEDERNLVLDYLAEHFGEDRGAAQRPATGLGMPPLMPVE